MGLDLPNLEDPTKSRWGWSENPTEKLSAKDIETVAYQGIEEESDIGTVERLAQEYLEEAQKYVDGVEYDEELLGDVEDAIGLPEEFRYSFREDIIGKLGGN